MTATVPGRHLTGRDLTSSYLTSIPRAVLSAAAGMVQTVERVVVGEARVRTARGNAWEAVCADRDRARRREEIRRTVAALTPPPAGQSSRSRAAGPVVVGSSPRSSASHASTVRRASAGTGASRAGRRAAPRS